MSTETVYSVDNDHGTAFNDDFGMVCDMAAEGEDGHRFIIYQGEVKEGDTGVTDIKPIIIEWVVSGPDSEGWDISSEKPYI